jgi:two-component system OmpR family response regulator
MRLLVVEDQPRMASLIKRGLEEEGHSVDVAADGPDAVWMATENEYRVVILDAMLPGFDGFEVARRLRTGGRWMPIVMLTARDSVTDRVLGLDSGADDYMTKPFSIAELAARIRALARRGSPERPTVLKVGNLHLDPALRVASRGEVELSLSPKEFALLELFMEYPGIVLTRTRIIEQIWDYEYDGVSNVVDQYVVYLRRKIDRPFGRSDLETVRGVGYRLRAPSS